MAFEGGFTTVQEAAASLLCAGVACNTLTGPSLSLGHGGLIMR